MKFRLPAISFRWFLIIALVVAAVDQATKFAIKHTLAFYDEGLDEWVAGEPLVIIPRVFQFQYRTNTGAAWSMFQGHPIPLALFSSAVAFGLAIWAWRLKPEEKQMRWSLGLILGGAVGNLIDRLRLGHVTDFIDAHWDNVYHFPTFNVADSAISIGMGLLILMTLTATTDHKPPEPGDASG